MQNERDMMAKGERERANNNDDDIDSSSSSGGDQTMILAASVTNTIYKLVTSDLSCIQIRHKKVHITYIRLSLIVVAVFSMPIFIQCTLHNYSVHCTQCACSPNTTAWCSASFNYDKLAPGVFLLLTFVERCE